ncbi:hypothetical protein CPB86DRAFT_738754 [Serendipita vermifera]|nr:hypothetical protein CPB86DRAFT_738754 [Serendipita vermifera]
MAAPTGINHTLEFYISAVQDITHSRYLSGSAVTLVIYDWLLLLGDESNTIWKSRWTIPKALYYLTRVITVPFIIFSAYELSDLRPALSKTVCAAWPAVVTVPMFTTFAFTNWLFTLRLVALYRRNRILVWFMRIFFAMTYIASLSMLIASLFKYRETVDYFPLFKACGALEASPVFPAMFYGPAAFEFFIFALTAYRAYEDANIFKHQLNGGKGGAPFLIVLYRDGLVCFLVMLGVRSWNIWIYSSQPITQLSLGTNIMWAINTILSTRVYLNLVWLAAKPDMTTINPGHAGTNIGFASVTYGGGQRIPRNTDSNRSRRLWCCQRGREGASSNGPMTTFGSLWEEQWAVPTTKSSITTNSDVVGAEGLDAAMEMKEPSPPSRRASGQYSPDLVH